MSRPLPTGTVTFMFTDIEGSSRLWEERPEPMAAAVAEHDRLLTAAVEGAGGGIVRSRGEGDQSGTTADAPDTFYGYYTVDFERDGKLVGMLSVNGFSGQVWYHTWHGAFVGVKDLGAQCPDGCGAENQIEYR